MTEPEAFVVRPERRVHVALGDTENDQRLPDSGAMANIGWRNRETAGWIFGVMELQRVDGYQLSSARERIDLQRVHGWLSTDAYWAMGRPLETTSSALDGSEVFGIYRGGEQVAVARVITDGAIFAYLCDVYVDRAHRGKGLGGWLVGALTAHYAGLGLRRFLLTTRDAHAIYAPHGFQEVEPGRWMTCDLTAVK